MPGRFVAAGRALREGLHGFRFTGRALALVWSLERSLFAVTVGLMVLAGVLPTVMAWVGRGVIDTAAALAAVADTGPSYDPLWGWVALEGALALALLAGARVGDVVGALLRVRLAHQVERMLLDRARRLPLSAFEDSRFYDRLVRARREAGSRPLSTVSRVASLAQGGASLAGVGALLWMFSPWAVLALVVAAVPAVLVEAKYSGRAFALANFRAPEGRERSYLSTLLTRDDYAKEVRAFGLGQTLLRRYDRVFERVYPEDRALAMARGLWGWVTGTLSSLVFFGIYGSIAWATARGQLTLGEMAMYVALVRQGQNAVANLLRTLGGTYEDNLYLSNLFGFLDHPVQEDAEGRTEGLVPGDGIRFEGVCFRYPGANVDALTDVDLHLPPGTSLALVGGNGSGKTTLVKLLTRLYTPTRGRILLDRLPLECWDERALRRRISLVFQDFIRYQMRAGDNIGLGDIDRAEDELGWRRAARRGMAAPFIEALPQGYETQVGRWFEGGVDLSGGQWQKLALSRAFMRAESDILVLDEPTSAVDPEAEQAFFEQVRARSEGRSLVLVSHRFSTVRDADLIVVMDDGRVVERGGHQALMADEGRYAQLFSIQAAGYR
ncbi:MAG: ABC transporter ATP-binding protein [Myxococcota bacterium]